MATEERVRLAPDIASASDVRWTERFVGSERVPEFEHRGVLFVLVPGGRFTMGFDAEEMRRLLRETRLAPNMPGADFWRPIYEKAYQRSRPTHAVDVAPFLCARAPLLDRQVRKIDRTLLLGEPFPLERRESAALPTFVTSDAAARLATHFGARLMSESEWEYVARGGGASFATRTYEDLHGPTFALYQRPAYDAHETTGIAIWGLAYGEWVADGWHDDYTGAPGRAIAWDPPSAPVMCRGGSLLQYPWQDSTEAITAHPAFRTKGPGYGERGCLRLALDCPR